jgi:hypothetical protein
MQGCGYESPERFVADDATSSYTLYTSLYDEFRDEGQYWLPGLTKKPASLWNCVYVAAWGNINTVDNTSRPGTEIGGRDGGLQYHLLAQSIQGLANRAVEEGRGTVGVWMTYEGSESYEACKLALMSSGVAFLGNQTALELATNDYDVANRLKSLWQGADGKYSYVLTDLKSNPQSGIVATMASHVHNAIIVDVRDQEFFDSKDYVMRYDARNKTTQDAWNEFKDQCNNNGLVLMPINTGQLRAFAIANKLFCMNLNSQYDVDNRANLNLLNEVAEWLEPGSGVYGWEQRTGEDVFVGPVSQWGNMMIPYDWVYNTEVTSWDYKNEQKSRLYSPNPQFYEYDDAASYVSFFLSDGDNVSYMMGSFAYGADVKETKMSFGIPVANLSMIAPAWMDKLIATADRESTLMESFGGGYIYADLLGEKKDRPAILSKLSKNVASHMRQRNCKVLHLFTRNSCTSDRAKEAYQSFIEANDQLEGIVSIQYNPYSGGNGEILWFKNKAGYDIPVVTVRYSIWENQNRNGQGTPAYVASLLNEATESQCSAVIVHAWSQFQDIGDSNDVNAENGGTGVQHAGAAKQCVKRLNDKFKVVNMHELMWQIRMKYRPEETKRYLSEIY